MPFGGLPPTVFVPYPLPAVIVSWQNNIELKEKFGIELAKGIHKNAFEAACSIFEKETNKALWASVHWLNDEIVLKAKKSYCEVISSPKKLLDKAELSAKLLSFSEDKIDFNGNLVYAAEAKDRLKALELYAKIQGYINDKTEINNNNLNNPQFVEIKFVEPERKNVKVIDNSGSQVEEEISLLPVGLKLVG